MAPEIDGKLYLTDIELANGEVAEAGDVTRVKITKTDAYDLIGRVVEILPRRAERTDASVAPMPPVAAAEKLHRIATGAPLRVLGETLADTLFRGLIQTDESLDFRQVRRELPRLRKPTRCRTEGEE